MRWHHQLRWKLFISHMVIIVIAVVVLLATANFLASTGLVQETPFTLGGAASETIQSPARQPLEGPMLDRFRLVVDQALLVAGFAALTTAVVVSLFVSRRIVEPLQELSIVSRRLAQGYYRERTTISADDELAELSQSINQLAETLEQTEQRRLSLLADVTHELRTPLATIEGYMEGLLDGVIAPSKPTFTLILRESVRLQRLIEDLQLLSRAEAGQLPVKPTALNLRERLEALAAQFEPQFAAQEIALGLEASPDLPPVWADPDRLDQVMINLLANAMRYTPTGGAVMIRALGFERFVQIAVCDSGMGIAPEHLPHLFERFYRVDKSRARQSGGSGIGLTIARHLIYAQGGDIWAESEGPGHGATFHLTLPVAIDAIAVPLPYETLSIGP
jgi:signal transduction histidine kinase